MRVSKSVPAPQLSYSGPLGCRGRYFTADYSEDIQILFRYTSRDAFMLIGSELYHFDAPWYNAVNYAAVETEVKLFYCPSNRAGGRIDLASISGHKFYGPKGVGALYVRRKNPQVQISAIIDGGGHERGMRSGTLNVPGIVGLGKACAIAWEELQQEAGCMAGLRNRLKDSIMNRLDEVYINGSIEHRLPGNLNVSFAHVEGESLLMGINDVAVSSGAACTSATLEPSYVLKALGTGDDLAHSSIRFGIGRFNTEAEIDYVADRVVETVQQLRELSRL